MIEKHIVLEDIDPVVFYGVGNGHLQMIKSLFPKLRIVARDNVIRILGDEEEMVKIEEDIETMRKHVERYNTITEEDILDIVKGREKLGFLPGDMKDKIDPYLQPLYDALEDMIPAVKLQDMMDKHIIQIAPLAFMRGRTLSDAVVILDEAQNTTPAQIRMFLTRMGWNTKMVITGDLTQIDLPHVEKSGLKEALSILSGVDGISVINLDKKDIVRHKLVTRIVNAYEAHDKANKR